MYKKILCIILAFMAFTLCLSACNLDNGAHDTEQNGGAVPPEDQAPPTTDAPSDIPDAPAPHEHTYSNEWSYNGEYHWHIADCSENAECANAVADKTAHTYDGNGVCNCGYEKKNVGPTPEEPKPEEPKPEEPKPEEPKPEEPKPEEPKPEILGTLNSDYGIILSNGTKVDVNYYPGFVRKALTFTIDDGNVQMDTAFLDIVRPAGIKGTFNLCGANAQNAANLILLYEGYEVANHNSLHSMVFRDDFDYSNIEIKDEVFNSSAADGKYMYKDGNIDGLYYIDYRLYNSSYPNAYWHPIASNETYTLYVDSTKAAIEAVFGEGSVVGYAYPHGSVNEAVKQYLKDAGYLYARDSGTIADKTNFALPADRFEWTYNADHTNLLEVMAKYDAYGDDGELKFFSFGVHSSDYKNSWDMLSEFAELYGNRSDEFWYATNREIFEYEDAIKALVISEEKIVNNSNITVYITVNNVMVKMPAGSTLYLEDVGENQDTIKPVIDFEDRTIPSCLTSSFGSTVANNVGLLVSEVTKNGKADKVLTLTTGPDGSDKITVRRTLKALSYEAITFKSDILFDTDVNASGMYTIQFKNKVGEVVYNLRMFGDGEGKISFDDYYRYNGKGIYTISSSGSGVVPYLMGNWFTLAFEISKNSEDKTVLKIFANESLVAECTHEAFYNVPLEDYVSLEISSASDTSGRLSFDNISFLATDRIVTEQQKDPIAEILPIKGGANGVVVLVHDDGDLASAARLDAIYEKYGIVGDVALIANRVWDLNTNAPISATQQGWQALFDNGRWGLINHSMTHAFTGVSTDDGYTIDANELYNEIVTSGEILRQVFPGQRVLTFAYPGFSSITNIHGKYPTMKDAINLVLEHYVGGRNYSGGVQSANKLIPWFSNGRTLGGTSGDIEQINSAATGNNSILVFLMHGVVESNPSGSQISTATVNKIANIIGKYADEGKIWSAHFEDAMLYLTEVKSASVVSQSSENEIKLTVTHSLDEEIYNYPLSVKVKLPEGWNAVKLSQGDRVTYVVAENVDGVNYAIVDVVPDGSVATVENTEIADVPEEYIPHSHLFEADWSFDKTNHWKNSVCSHNFYCAEAVSEFGEHSFDENNLCECGYELHIHTYKDTMEYDDINHWYSASCSANDECLTAVKDLSAHSYNEDGLCICGHVYKVLDLLESYYETQKTAYETVIDYNGLAFWKLCVRNDSATLKVLEKTNQANDYESNTYVAPTTVGDRSVFAIGKNGGGHAISELAFYNVNAADKNCVVFESDVMFHIAESDQITSANQYFSRFGFMANYDQGGNYTGGNAVTAKNMIHYAEVGGAFDTEANKWTEMKYEDRSFESEVWYRITMEYYKAEGVIKYYVDGYLVGTAEVEANLECNNAVFQLQGQAYGSRIYLDNTYMGTVDKHIAK